MPVGGAPSNFDVTIYQHNAEDVYYHLLPRHPDLTWLYLDCPITVLNGGIELVSPLIEVIAPQAP